MVKMFPDNVPITLVLPVTEELASVQLAVVSENPVAGVSVNVTAVPIAVTLIAVGLLGVAVAATVVLILAGALAKLVCVKLKGPPTPLVVVFCTLTVGILALVTVQLILEPGAVAAAFKVN